MSGFVAELLVFLGSIEAFEVQTVLAVVGILLSAGYILWTVERIMFGPENPRWSNLPDTDQWWEWASMAALAALIIAVGIYPSIVVDTLENGIVRTMEFI
jgi:NADH-quinone oxidoreductase subunit M